MKRLYIQSNYVTNVLSSLRLLRFGNIIGILTALCYLYSPQVIGSESRNLNHVSNNKTNMGAATSVSTSKIPLGKGNYRLTMIFKKFSAPAGSMVIKAENSVIIDDLRKYQPSNKEHSFSVTKEISVADGTLDLAYNDEVAEVMITMLFKKTSGEPDEPTSKPKPSPEPSPKPTPPSEDTPSATKQGVNYEYYIGKWGMLPRFERVTIRKKGVVSNFSLQPRQRNDQFAFRFKTYLKIDKSGTYTFYTKSDDGSRLKINHKIIVDNNGKHALREKSGKVYLSKGMHAVEVTYFEYTGGENLIVSYKGPGISKRAIPDNVLFISAENKGSKPAPTPPTTRDSEQYKINFSNELSSSAWNNFVTQPTAGKSLRLKSSEGKTSSVSLKLETSWNEAKDKGYNSGNNKGIYPDAVMQTYFYTSGEETVSISGLSSKQSYDFTFFASSTYGGNRTTEFIIGSKKVSLNAAHNKDKTVTLKDIKADAQGKVTIKVRKAKGASYAFLNAMVISAEANEENVPEPAPSSVAITLAQLPQSTCEAGSSIALTANFEVSNDNVQKVIFYANDKEIAQVSPKSGKTSVRYTWKNLTAGTYQLKAVAEAAKIGKVSSSTRTLKVEKKVAATQQGVNYEYYIGKWGMLPPFNKVTVRKKGVVSNFSLGPRDRDNFFGFKFKAYLKIDRSGEYTFYTKSDDGSRLKINHKIIVDNNGKHALREKSGKVYLSKGMHAVEVTYFEYTGGENLIVSYKGPGISKRTIPNNVLFTTDDTPAPAPAPPATRDSEQYKINFSNELSSSAWNNFVTQPTAGKSLRLKSSEGKASSVSLKLETSWNEAKDKGYNSGNNKGIYPDAVMQTYFYTSGEETVSISGLSSKQSYDFTFFASSTYGGNRTTEFIIGSKKVSLNAAHNKDKTVTLKNIKPDGKGKVMIRIRKASGASYAFLNAMIIKTADTNARTVSSKKAEAASEPKVMAEETAEIAVSKALRLYPVPAKDVLYVETPANSAFTIYNVKGQIVKQGNVSQFNTNSISVTGLKHGIYHIHFISHGNSMIKKFIVAP